MLDAISSLASAFGLSTAAGLNAYIPLLTTAIMAHKGILKLPPDFQFMASPWWIGLLIVLLIVEIVVDKIPGADHVNDIVQTVVRPAAGALLFASQAGNISADHPVFFGALGLLASGGVHGTKALARPIVNVTTAGVGAPIVSVVEDLVSTVVAILAVLLPILAVLLIAFFAWVLFKLFRKLFWRKRHPVAVRAIAIDSPEPAAAIASSNANWGGGV